MWCKFFNIFSKMTPFLKVLTLYGLLVVANKEPLSKLVHSSRWPSGWRLLECSYQSHCIARNG